MAITKIKPIRGTVNKAIAYILDPKKTDERYMFPPLDVLPAMPLQRNLSGRGISQSKKECSLQR